MMKAEIQNDFIGQDSVGSAMESGKGIFRSEDFGWDLESEFLHDHTFRPDNVCETWELDDTLGLGAGESLFFD